MINEVINAIFHLSRKIVKGSLLHSYSLTVGDSVNGTDAIPPKFSWAVKVSSFETFI